MSILIKGMEMPKDCPFCPMAHFNKLDALTGCDVVPGKRYVKESETDYWNSDKRPDWCPFVEIPTPHGRLIDADAFEDAFIRYYLTQERQNNLMFAAVEIKQQLADMIADFPTIIEAEGVTK